MAKTLFIIDIDGTIAHAGRRFAEAGPEPTRESKEVYDSWVSRVQSTGTLLEDKPVPGMAALVHALYYGYVDAVYLTSREECWRETTRLWLSRNSFPFLGLKMRGNGNYAEGADFKETTIDALQQEYKASVVVVIDDDGQGTIEPMCKRRGWTFLKCRSGGGDVVG